jgi:hypothetical protein
MIVGIKELPTFYKTSRAICSLTIIPYRDLRYSPAHQSPNSPLDKLIELFEKEKGELKKENERFRKESKN